MTYAYSCEACGPFEAQRSVAQRDQADCPRCQGPGARVFRPDWIAIQTPAHLATIRADYQPLSTAEHTASYLEGQALDNHVSKLYAAQAAAQKNRVPFETFFAQRNPDLDTRRPLTRQESREVKQALTGAPHD